MKPFFSVVIPLFNKEKFIDKTIKCVLQQSFSDFEIIIVDDGSTDNSLNKIKAFNDKRINVYTQKNAGASEARNYGIEKANGHFIALLDADDYWESDHLQALKDSINKFPEAGLYCTNFNINFDGTHSKKSQFNFLYDTQIIRIPDFFMASSYGFVSSSSSTAFRKVDFLKLGGYRKNIKSGEDTDVWIRFGLDYEVVFNPTITAYYNQSDDSSLSKGNQLYDIYTVISSYKEKENNNASLKYCLDAHRYALAMQCAFNNTQDLYSKLKNEIDFNNLNWKQKVLLRLPRYLLILMKKAQLFLAKRQIYTSTFK